MRAWPRGQQAEPSSSSSVAPAALSVRPEEISAVQLGPRAIGRALGMLLQLRVASLDRLVREVRRAHGQCTRAAVLAELEQEAARVQWFGRSVVAVQEGP